MLTATIHNNSKQITLHSYFFDGIMFFKNNFILQRLETIPYSLF